MNHHVYLSALLSHMGPSCAVGAPVDSSPPSNIDSERSTDRLATDEADSDSAWIKTHGAAYTEDAPSDSGYSGTDEADSLFGHDDVSEVPPNPGTTPGDSLTTTNDHRRAFPMRTDETFSLDAPVLPTQGGECWLCGSPGKHITHVIAEPDHVIVEHFTQQGLLPRGPHAPEDLLLLCPPCHRGFTLRTPTWTFLPEDLAGLLAHEEAFHSRRSLFAAVGLAVEREDTRNRVLRYRCYRLRNGRLLSDAWAQPVRFWCGNPVAAVLRNYLVVGGTDRLDEVAVVLRRLVGMYAAPVPQLVPLDGSGVTEDRERLDSRGQRGRKRRCDGDEESVPMAKRTRTQRRWLFGPAMTTNRIVEWYRDVMGSAEREREEGYEEEEEEEQ